jgi:hypothetical protein
VHAHTQCEPWQQKTWWGLAAAALTHLEALTRLLVVERGDVHGALAQEAERDLPNEMRGMRV